MIRSRLCRKEQSGTSVFGVSCLHLFRRYFCVFFDPISIHKMSSDSKDEDKQDDQSQDDTNDDKDNNEDDQKEDDSNDTDNQDSPKPTKLSPGAIAGIVIAVVVVIIVVVVVVVLTMPQTSSSSSGSSSASSGSSSGSSSSSLSATNTTQFLGVIVSGQPNFPGAPTRPILGPFSTVSPPVADANVLFVQNNNGDAFQGRINSATYPGGNSLNLFCGAPSSGQTVTLAVLGYSLKTNSSSFPQDPFVPFCQSYVISLTTPQSTTTTLGIPFTLTGSATDYVSFAQSGDVSNSCIVFGSKVTNTTTVTLAYVAGAVGLARFNLFVAKINTSGTSTGPVLYAENVTISTGPNQNSTNYTLKSSISVPSGTIQWFAQPSGGSLLQEVIAIRQIAPNQVRLLTSNNVTNMTISLIAFRSINNTGFSF